jgi:hypothetical protein
MAIGDDDLKKDDKSKPKYSVWVYQMVEGKWVEQTDRKLVTADAEQARKYAADVKKTPGLVALSDAIEPVRMPDSGPLVGKWRTTFGDFVNSKPPGTYEHILLLFDDGTGVLTLWGNSKKARAEAIEWKSHPRVIDWRGNTKELLFCQFGKAHVVRARRLWELKDPKFENGQLVEFTATDAVLGGDSLYKRLPASKK